MKLVSYLRDDRNHLGLSIKGHVYCVSENARKLGLVLPDTMKEFLTIQEAAMPDLLALQQKIIDAPQDFEEIKPVTLLAPVPEPPSLRDGYAFRQHVQTMRQNRDAEMTPEFDQFPIFYFSNHNAVYGPGDVLLEKDHFERMDFELEVAMVVGKRGKNISAQQADDYIFGYMIWNDFSARRLQLEEMKLSLGPAKGKDFANSFGPYLVTKDELASKRIKTDHGDKYDLRMTAKHNGKLISDGNMKTMDWTFAEILERVSYGTEVYPGDIIGSGTVGTGCYAEINGTGSRLAKEKGDTYTPVWLEPNDAIELEIEGLGILQNKLLLNQPEYSILEKKKNLD
jgi:fumarylacetoacetate (FAA) hydrolase